MTQTTPIHLVLGSGGARGLTHIGAVRVLQAHGYEIRSITGCSMGALVGADIIARKEVWISRGDLLQAVRASIAVPGVFTPLVTHGRVLVDGGILNPLPIPPSGMDNSTLTVAVSLSGREVLHPYAETGAARPAPPEPSAAPDEGDTGPAGAEADPHQPIEGFLDSLQRFFGRERGRVEALERDATQPQPQPPPEAPDSAARAHKDFSRPALTDVMLGMFNTMQDTIARHQLASNPPDILIDIPCNICQSHEFHRAAELIPAGEYWARRALEQQRDR